MADTFDSSAQYPDLQTGNGVQTNGSTLRENVTNSASNTMNSIQSSQTVQNIANGPVADKARLEAANTKNEFSNLAASRQTPNSKTATGQNLTHYHSLFYSLLSWENPRATAISFATAVSGILLVRFVPVDRYVLKAIFSVLGVTAAAELAGHFVLGEGLATKLRPRKYYTIPRETLESITGDLEELINFFVIEFQRILFAENVWATIAAFFTALIGYFLVKVTPKWGLLLISTCVVYLAPLIYISNKELIDTHLNNAAKIANQQTEQLREVAAKNTNKAMEATSSATSQYVSLAQEYIGGAKKTAVDKGYVSKETADKAPGAPVEKSYTSAAPTLDTTSTPAPVEKASSLLDTSSSPIAAEKPISPIAEKPASPIVEKASSPIASHSGPENPVAPIENISSSIQPTPIIGTTDFPAAPSNEPHIISPPHEVPAVPSAIDGAAPVSTETHGIEEKKEPLHAI